MVKNMEFTDSNNRAELIGTVESEPQFSHEIYAEAFYLFILNVPRLSGVSDHIRIIASERLLSDFNISLGDRLMVEGQFRSYNSSDNGSNHLILSVFARDIKYAEEKENKNPNTLFLNGYVCKEPVYRTTPFGREICDILLAVNRTYNKSDYIPIITWGRNARFCKHIGIGSNLKIWGRIQSRIYQKRTEDDDYIEKTAYEVSVCRMEM
ncbi:MAG: single-stranded DNA-binding protein [Eubacteriales bacterium]|nr:single-stranded DNA-binding protein [Eubacteriales bacterium]